MNENEQTNSSVANENVEPFLKKAEVCQRLQIQLRTVEQWMKRGLVPYYKLGRTVRFKWSEIERHLAQACRVSRRSSAVA